MKRILLAVLVGGIALSCNQTSSAQKVNEVIAPVAFQAKMDDLKNEIIIDVRTPGEQADGFIEDALFLDYKDSNFRKDLAKLDKTKPVMVYCASGGRSGKTAVILKSLGFEEVYDLAGGMGAWKAANMKVSHPE